MLRGIGVFVEIYGKRNMIRRVGDGAAILTAQKFLARLVE